MKIRIVEIIFDVAMTLYCGIIFGNFFGLLAGIEEDESGKYLLKIMFMVGGVGLFSLFSLLWRNVNELLKSLIIPIAAMLVIFIISELAKSNIFYSISSLFINNVENHALRAWSEINGFAS